MEIEELNPHPIKSATLEIVPFEELKCTTMTLIMTLTNSVDKWLAFQLLPITRIVITQTKITSKCKLPHHEVPGSILSMSHQGDIRGIIRNHSNSFKNAVTIDIATRKKNINVKLAPASLQMCGASSMEDGIEAATHILNHLKYIQEILIEIQADLNAATKCIEWVSDNTKGESIKKPFLEIRECPNLTLNIYSEKDEFTIVKPSIPVPDNLNVKICNFLLGLCDDYMYHGDMCKKLHFITKVTNIIEDSLEIEDIAQAMVNYNFKLGIEIDRDALSRNIDGRNGFVSHFNIAFSTSVRVELPYQPAPSQAIKRRKNKVPHITFLVYKSGSVTQSGPGGKIMEDSYNLFTSTITEIYDLIQYPSLNNNF